MIDKSNLGIRMKQYEAAYKLSLPIRMPVILRLDGKAFHSYTKPLKKHKEPYNREFEKVMNLTAIKLCEEIQGAQIAYVQSDEISIFVHNYKKRNSQSWFANELQKMVSVSAAIAAATFTANSWKVWWAQYGVASPAQLDDVKPAYFDSRAFILPESEICNYFVWRQSDCTRNSIQSLTRSLYSHKECNNKNNEQLQEMCHKAGRNWNDEPNSFKRGRCIIQKEKKINLRDNPPMLGGKGKFDEPYEFDVLEIIRKEWVVDEDIPVFTQDRNYIDKYLETIV